MLAPEVWNFEPPSSSTQYKFVNDDKEIHNVVTKQYFNHFVSITVPDALHIHSSIRDILTEDSEFYHVEGLLASELVNFEFIELFVRKGELTLLSVGTKLDEDDCLALTPNGKLILSLCRKTFQELGLEGKPSSFSNKAVDKYVVSVDLKDDSFCPGKKNYKRVLERLQEKTHLFFNVVLAWKPPKQKICPSSIAAYLVNHGFKVKTCFVKINQWHDYDVDVPVFDDETDGDALTEWLGAFNLRCNIPETANGYTSTYQRPGRFVTCGQVVCYEAVGLFTAAQMKNLVAKIQNYADNLSMWLALNVNGFEDAVVNRGNQEHFFYSNGDYHYTVFYRRAGPSLLYVHTSSTRKPKTSTKKKKKK